jgi:methionyl aminopeptidase
MTRGLLGSVDAALPLPLATPPPAPRSPLEDSACVAPIVGEMMVHLGAALQPGLAVRKIEAIARSLLEERALRSSMEGYNGFPSPISVSIDDQVMHAIDGARIIPDRSLVKIQFGARGPGGGGANMGWTFAVGDVGPEKASVRSATIEALRAGLAVLRENARVGDLGAAIQTTLEARGCNAVRDFVGYGFGERMMMDPQLKCYGRAGTGQRLHAGMLLHVHAIAAAGDWQVEVGEDRWTVRTQDRRPAALATALVRITASGAELLSPLVTSA